MRFGKSLLVLLGLAVVFVACSLPPLCHVIYVRKSVILNCL